MKAYISWSLRQLYLIYFWPTRFKREVETSGDGERRPRLKERAWYMLKMLPWLILINVFVNLTIGFICERFGIAYRWNEPWVWIGMVFGVVGGVACGVASDVFVGMVFGMIFSAATGIPFGVAFGVVYGLALGVAFSTGYFMVGGVKGGLGLGVMFGVVGGAVNGVAGGIAGCVALWFSYFRLFTYPFDVALSLVAYTYGNQSPQNVERAWRLCPVAWNEVVWLPLPFAAKLLTMITKQDRKEGFRQIAFVAAERRLQKQVASHASEEIAINDLQATSIKQLAAFTHELDWTTIAPSELPEVLVAALPRFDGAAQHVDQYLMLKRNHHKGEALKRALAELAGLQKRLIAAHGWLAARLLLRANEWRALLEVEQKTFVANSTASREIPAFLTAVKPEINKQREGITSERPSDHIIVDIHTPSDHALTDTHIPSEYTVKEIIHKVIEHSMLPLRDDDDELIKYSLVSNGITLDKNQTLLEAGVKDGDRLHLVSSQQPASDAEKAQRLCVFLCHSSSDKQAVRMLYQRLLADGFDPWLDEEKLLPGQDWEHEITMAVRKSDVVIVCLSKGSINKKGYVQKEIGYALDVADEQPEGTIFLIPLKLEECYAPDRLRRWHWVNLFEASGYERLLQSLNSRASGLGLNTAHRSKPVSNIRDHLHNAGD
jgi:uncharacterized ubiquitin-like protein YukD/MFS family permease